MSFPIVLTPWPRLQEVVNKEILSAGSTAITAIQLKDC